MTDIFECPTPSEKAVPPDVIDKSLPADFLRDRYQHGAAARATPTQSLFAEAPEPIAETPERIAEAPEPIAEAPEPIAETPKPMDPLHDDEPIPGESKEAGCGHACCMLLICH